VTETVNMPQLAAHDRCTGCGACSSGCPKGAIRMAPDREGFLYPEVTDGCVQCGHCAHVCPVQKQREHRTAPQVFAVWSRDESVRQASTCGGAFSALAEYVLEGGGVVFGAALDENLRVVHTAVKNVHDLSRLRGMKPVQSDTGDAYQQVRLYLDQGRQVLFSGTPCQVDGLYRYLGEHPERLLTCDVACGGVCSPGVWAQLVKSMAYVKQHRPTAVEFCGKLTGDRERRFRVKFEGGGRYDAPMGKCELGRGIARRLFMRPACHRCAYATTDRPGDVTLGDFSGGSFAPEEKKSGVSMLLINTAKGAQVFDMLPLERQHRTLEEAEACCAALREPPMAPAEREKFFHAMEQLPFQQVRARFLSALQHQSGGVTERLLGLLRREKKEKKA
jgi:coenzyme F420-reducing hydrogenase beta subunit